MRSSSALIAGVELSSDKSIKLLIIDDVEADRKVVGSILRYQGELAYEVSEAADIQSGLTMCEAVRPDCVLLDYMLQGETGTDWIGECKTAAGNPHLPVIMLTGVGDESLAVSAFHAGAADYLAKGKASAKVLERAISNAVQKAELHLAVEEERAHREELLEQLAQKNDELQSLYHTVSHELKTPLTAAREFVSLMLDEVAGPINATQKEFLETTQGCCDRLGFLLNNWLDTVRSETGKLALNVAPTDLAKIVRDTVKIHDVLATKANVTLAAEIDEVGEIELDGERMQQVLTNLLSNAFKFTAADGSVTVRCRRSENEVTVSVSDTGRGIQPAHQEQVFSPFFQAERADTSQAKGMGLGLHVCRTIVELHSGTMTLHSEVGVGTTFTIHLPIRG